MKENSFLTVISNSIEATYLCIYYHKFFWITDTDPKEYLTEAGSAFSKAETHWFENEDQTKKQKGVLAYHDGRKEIVISFRGSVETEDWLVNLSLELVEVGKH